MAPTKRRKIMVAGHCAIQRSDTPANDKFQQYDERTGKPYIILKFSTEENGDHYVALTSNLAEMIGGFGKGTREYWEELQAKKGKQ